MVFPSGPRGWSRSLRRAAWALLMVGSAWAQEDADGTMLSFEEAWQRVQDRSPVLKAASLAQAAAQGGLRQSEAYANPELSVTVEDTRPATRTTTVLLSQPLELGGQRAARQAAAQAAVAVQTAAAESRRHELRAQTLLAYHAVQVAQERLRLSQDTLQAAERAAQAAGLRVSAGRIPPLEGSRARVAASTARLAQDQAQALWLQRWRELGALWGADAATVPARVQPLPLPTEPPSLSQLQDRLQTAPTLLEGRQGVEQLRAQARLEHTRSWGIPALSMGIKRDASQPGHQWVLGVSLPLPLLDRNQGQFTQAQHLADQAEALLEARRTELWTTLVNTQEQLRTRLKELDVLNSEVLPLAESAYQAASLGFEKGKFSFLEVLDAQRTLSDVREQVLAARLQAAQASAELERLVGPLLHP